MKKQISIITIACTLSALTLSCGNSDIDSWNVKGYVWFTDTLQNFTNMQQPDVPLGGQLTIAVPLTLATDVATVDREVNVGVVRQPSDSRTQFEIQTPVVIRAGHLTDTMYVKLTNSSHLDAVYDSITFRILESESFSPGLNAYQQTTLALHNGYARPAWWDTNGERYLGRFTQLKMQVYVAVTGGTDDPRSDKSYWNYSDLAITYWVFMLNDYVEQNDIRYPDDDPYAPGQQPKFAYGSY